MAKSTKILKSKTTAWCAFLLILLVIILTYPLRCVWWAYFDIFFAFMMVFMHVIALTIEKYNVLASSKLEKISLIMGIMTVLSLIGEWIAFQIILS